MCGKTIRVGTTFDPGPEFAISKFKYVDHPEVCTAGTMGDKSFVVSYETLHGDKKKYRAYPDGIPEGTPFAEFLGRQSQVFMDDMGFDYIWFSNGFGFGAENWATTGPLFDGTSFTQDSKLVQNVKDKTLKFWEQFREGCKDYQVQTRGTNLSVGIDFASDGVDVKDIYQGDFNIVAPPNSPWAALDKNFGLEMCGYMSRIAELPDDAHYMYRFYMHDPWWMNSPWFDRYEGEPHDIYLPLAVSRINHQLQIELPDYMNILTVDTSLGDMPQEAVEHVMPHIRKAIQDAPDRPGPLVWLYPFDEYQSPDEHEEYALAKAFFEDWYITSAINHGLPLNTVISTSAFIEQKECVNAVFDGCVILTPVPRQDSNHEKAVLAYVEQGGDILMYGSLREAGEKIRSLLHVELTSGLDGEMEYIQYGMDALRYETNNKILKHNALLSDGDIDTIMKEHDHNIEILSYVREKGQERVTGISYHGNGQLVWLRGTNCNEQKEGINLLQPLDEDRYMQEDIMLRHALMKFDYHIEYMKRDSHSKLPALTIHRHDNAFMFSGYVPDTSVGVRMHFPLGVPVMIGHEVYMEDGYGTYHFPRSFHRECRVFVEQEENGSISMSEYGPVSVIMKRRILLEGLKNATIYVFPQDHREGKCELLLNSLKPNIVGEPYEYEHVETPWGNALRAEQVSGQILVSFEFDEVDYLEKRRMKHE